jgi:hypothetical protein
MKTTSLLVLLVVGTFPVLFSSCSATDKTAAAPGPAAHTGVANHEHYSSAAMGYDNTWPYGPNTYR